MASQSEVRPVPDTRKLPIDAKFYDDLRIALAGGKLNQMTAKAESAGLLEERDAKETTRILNTLDLLLSLSPAGSSPVPAEPALAVLEREERETIFKIVENAKDRIKTNPKVLFDFVADLKQEPAHEEIAKLLATVDVPNGSPSPTLDTLKDAEKELKMDTVEVPNGPLLDTLEQDAEKELKVEEGSPDNEQPHSKQARIEIGSGEVSNYGSVFGHRSNPDYEYDVPKGATNVYINTEDKSDDAGMILGDTNGDASLKWNEGEEKAYVHAWVNGKLGGTTLITWTVYAVVPS